VLDAEPQPVESISRAFRKSFPNSVARDPRVPAPLLVLLAYRSTIADEKSGFGLNEKTLKKAKIVRPDTGLGKNALRRAIALGKSLGYLQRQQNGRTGRGRFKFATDSLNLPLCGYSGNAGRHVRQEWFNGRLSVKEMAAYLFFRAGTGKGQTTFAKELAERFDWSRPTAAKAIKALRAFGLLAMHEVRTKRSHCQKTVQR
jgi:hypothetical protein